MKSIVIGAGVNALTSAILLQRNGFRVCLIAHEFFRKTTSTVAGALWEMPPAVCGFFKHVPGAAVLREKEWAIASYQRFKDLASDRKAGVFLRPVVFYLKEKLQDNPLEAQKYKELSQCVDGLIHDSDLVKHQQNPDYIDAYSYISPQIDTDVYMTYLYEEFLNQGGEIRCQTLSSLSNHMDDIQAGFDPDFIVNCSGLGARHIVPDEQVLPVRGAWLLVQNDGTHFPKVETAYCTSLEALSSDGAFMFILPRGENHLVIGGIAQPHQWEKNLTKQSPAIQKMLEACFASFPMLRQADFENAEFRVGLRPFRMGGVRLDLDDATYKIPVISNYGHGGAGVLLSWGCADDVLKLAQNVRDRVSSLVAV